MVDDASQDAGWIAHDGSAKRPKGVGKRDAVGYGYVLGNRWRQGGPVPANSLDWEIITHYRVTERAPKKEKRRKIWVVEADNDFLKLYRTERLARLVCGEMPSGKLLTGKLKEVKQ